jgi:membrane protein required for colicin V production
VVIGFNTGLLRSAIAILAYIAAMPIALGLVPLVSPQLDGQHALPFGQNSGLFFGAFLVIGMVLGKLACLALDDVIGPQAGIADRLGGAALGAVRVGLIAITVVLIFDQLLPANLQPAFMAGSTLRPVLSAAGQMGLKSLPPDLVAAIDRLKKRPAHLIGAVSLICVSAVAAPLSGRLDLVTVGSSDFQNIT